MTADQQFTVALVTIAAGVLTTALAAVFAARKSASNAGKLDEIHILVNSNLTEVKNQLARAQAQLTAMQAVIDSGKPLVSGESLVSGADVQAILDNPHPEGDT